MRISERLKLVCEQNNWKIKDFAEISGLPYRTMQGYINGEREPNAEGMSAIAKAGINLNWLVSGNGEMFTTFSSELVEQEKQLLTQFRQCNSLGKKAIELNLSAISQYADFIE
ncbi:helix-turn-helix domain-containing protein [Pasteurella multocida]|uniref:helix-turn-helix domain-containing protein n=1 Tax=Pasteurella multocida TaxID=747 RepID=UPI001118656B|nr:helix-turn-helix transcriptional regulator [Pasteurella multocida]MDY0632152.1 helix-turn-helix domain-containing protein [Pasteurella multocida]QDA12086.1 XRE family transcriptional regulator [Pasteurella multocida subsp. multocida]